MYKLLLSIFFSTFLFASEGNISILCFENNATLGIQDVISRPAHLFYKELQEHTKFKANADVWIAVFLENKSVLKVDKVLKFLDIRLDRIDIYSKDGRLMNTVGDRAPFNNRILKDAQIAIEINVRVHSSKTLYLHVTNEDKVDLTYRVFDKQEYIEDFIHKKIVQALFFGALIIMLIYNFVLMLFIRDRAFYVYIAYHIAVLIVMFYYNGLIIEYYMPYAYDVNGGNVPWYFTYASIILAIEFLRRFLNLKEFTPKQDKVLLYTIIIILILSLFAPFDLLPKQMAILIMVPASFMVLFVAFYHSTILRRPLAFFYLFGWITMLVAVVLTALLSFGVIERNIFTVYTFQIGIITEITLLSMGLAYRYKLNQDQLIEKTKVLHEQSKLASMGEMLRHIAHQWRQPLSEINSVAMKIEIDHRRKTMDDVSLDKNIEHIENITEHMSKTIQDFNGYFKVDKEKVSVTLESVVDKAIGLVTSGLSKNEIKIEKIVSCEKKVNIVEGELIQVLLVLLNNARDVIKNSDTKEKWIKIYISQEGKHYVVEVEDSGGGIDEANLSKVFEPYFTTKFESQGVGIGLYMSKMIVEESMGGRLSVSNSVDGAIFKILFEC